MKTIRIIGICIGVLIFGSCLALKVAKKTGVGCKVCIHGDKNAKHTGFCTVFIKDDSLETTECSDDESCNKNKVAPSYNEAKGCCI